jgi:hypothetical protein
MTTKVSSSKPRKVMSGLEKIKVIVSKYKDQLCVIAYSEKDDYYLIAKKQIFTVHTLNENSVFMPHEKKEDKEIPLLFLLTFGNCKKKISLLSNIKLLKNVKIVILPKKIDEIEHELLKLSY